MIHFLRTTDNETVIEATAGKDDLSVVVALLRYSEMLLDTDPHGRGRAAFIADFSALQELRGEYFEHPSRTKAHYPETPDEFVERRFREVRVRWDLRYVTD